jgi:hypothetical protein
MNETALTANFATLTVYLMLYYFRFQYFTHLLVSVSTNTSQGIHRMIQGYSLRSATLYHLKSRGWLIACSFLNVCTPCKRNKTPEGKTHVTISHKKLTPAYSWPLLSSKRFKTLYGKEAYQTSTHIWVEVYLYSPCGPLVIGYRVTFTLHIRPTRWKCGEYWEILATKPFHAFQNENKYLHFILI